MHGTISGAITKKIPKGKVTTYKEIGKALKRKGQVYRAVGRALNQNTNLKIPCHRVINSTGFVGNYNQGINKKIKLLKKEEILIKNKKIDLKKYLFRF